MHSAFRCLLFIDGQLKGIDMDCDAVYVDFLYTFFIAYIIFNL